MTAIDRLIALLSRSRSDADKWITVHPNGKDGHGTPALIGEDGTVKGGMGGKFNGKSIKDAHGTERFTSGETNAETEARHKEQSKPEKSAAELASEKANKLSETAKTSREHREALEAHLAAYKAHGNKEVGLDHYEQFLKHRAHEVKAIQAERRAEKAQAKKALSATDAGKEIAAREAKFKDHTPQEVDAHFRDKFGLGFSNGSNADREYTKIDKDYRKRYWDVSEDERAEIQKKLTDLSNERRLSHGHRISSHTEYDITDGSAPAKAQRKMLGHIDNALSEMDKLGFNVKAALQRGNVKIASGTTGESNGHAWQGHNGVGYFSINLAKNGGDNDRETGCAQARKDKGLPKWSIYANPDYPEDAKSAIVRHELAHAIGLQRNIQSPNKLAELLNSMDFSEYRKETSDNPAIQKGLDRRNWIKQNISEYATTNIRETDAELAAMVTAPYYVRGTLPKQLEDHVDWLFMKRS